MVPIASNTKAKWQMESLYGLQKSKHSNQKHGMASGYHQAPIDEQSKHLTILRTATGLWEWNRLPMGLQGAGSYFQHNVEMCNM